MNDCFQIEVEKMFCLDCGVNDSRYDENEKSYHCGNCGGRNFGKKEDFRYEVGDRVYHKNLELYGTFVEYDWTGNSECHVDFDNEDGFEDCRHVSTNQLILVERKK